MNHEFILKDGKSVRCDNRRFLKIKLKSLAAEARIIRAEERKTSEELRHELHLHRVRDVRGEARATHIAYGFIRGTPYGRVEAEGSAMNIDMWKRVEAMVWKYGGAQRGASAAEMSKKLKEWSEA
jgi:hypothetical protein